jgi:hypothetical protein
MNLRKYSWFFSPTKTATRRGTRFKNGDRPDEATFSDLIYSSTLRSEADHRAKEDTGTFNGANNGHVTLASNTQAKDYSEQKDDRSLVLQPHQSPEVSTTHSFVSVTKDSTEVRRNKFLVNLSTAFDTAWNSLQQSITTLMAAKIPAGGTTGQVLSKSASDDYATVWIDVTSGTNVALAAPDSATHGTAPNQFSGSDITIDTSSAGGVTTYKPKLSDALWAWLVAQVSRIFIYPTTAGGTTPATAAGADRVFMSNADGSYRWETLANLSSLTTIGSTISTFTTPKIAFTGSDYQGAAGVSTTYAITGGPNGSKITSITAQNTNAGASLNLDLMMRSGTNAATSMLSKSIGTADTVVKELFDDMTLPLDGNGDKYFNLPAGVNLYIKCYQGTQLGSIVFTGQNY